MSEKRAFVVSVISESDSEEYFYQDFYVFAESLESAFNQVVTTFPKVYNIFEVNCFPHFFHKPKNPLNLFEFYQNYLGERYRSTVLAETTQEAFSLFKEVHGADVNLINFYKLDENIKPWSN